MDETIYVIFKAQFDFTLEVWSSIVRNIYSSDIRPDAYCETMTISQN